LACCECRISGEKNYGLGVLPLRTPYPVEQAFRADDLLELNFPGFSSSNLPEPEAKSLGLSNFYLVVLRTCFSVDHKAGNREGHWYVEKGKKKRNARCGIRDCRIPKLGRERREEGGKERREGRRRKGELASGTANHI
jgi:hypothetical protein